MNERRNKQGKESKRPRKQSRLLNYTVIIASIIVILGGIHATRSLLSPFLMATFLTVLLISPINWLKEKGASTLLAFVIVIFGVIASGTVVIMSVAPQLKQFGDNLSDYQTRLDSMLSRYGDLSVSDFLPSFLRNEERTDTEDGKDDGSKDNTDAPVAPDGGNSESVRARGESNAVKTAEWRDSDSSPRHTTTQTAYALKTSDAVDANRFETAVAESKDDSLPTSDFADRARSTWEEEGNGIIPNPPKDGLSPPPSDSVLATELELAGKEHDEETMGLASDDEFENFARPITTVGTISNNLFGFLKKFKSELSYFSSATFFIVLLVVFMLVETAKIPEKLKAVWGERRFTNSHFDKIIADIRRYMVIKTEMSLVVCFCVVVMLTLTGVKYPLLWGLVAFLLNYIPSLGSTIAAIPPCVMAFIDCGIVVGCVDLVGYVAINCTVGYVLEPRYLGKGLDLSPLVVLLSMVFFGWLFGPVGLFLSPPLAVILKIIFQSFPETRWIAALMANNSFKEQTKTPPGATQEN